MSRINRHAERNEYKVWGSLSWPGGNKGFSFNWMDEECRLTFVVYKLKMCWSSIFVVIIYKYLICFQKYVLQMITIRQTIMAVSNSIYRLWKIKVHQDRLLHPLFELLVIAYFMQSYAIIQHCSGLKFSSPVLCNEFNSTKSNKRRISDYTMYYIEIIYI